MSDSKHLTFLDLFSGIGGFHYGMSQAGHKCVGFCEFDKYAVASYTSMYLITEEQRKYLATLDLKQRQKEILKEEYRNGTWYSNDIRNVTGGSVPHADIWCFGSPCTSFSLSGKREGLDGESGLVREVFRILWEIEEDSRPEWIIYENVKGMFSSNRGFDFLAILIEMDSLGYDIEWELFNSKWYIPQNRERVYTIGHFRKYGRSKIFPIIPTNEKDNSERVNSDITIKQIGGISRDSYNNPDKYRVYASDGLSPTLQSARRGGTEPHIAEKVFDFYNQNLRDDEVGTLSTGPNNFRKSGSFRIIEPLSFIDIDPKLQTTDFARTIKASQNNGRSNFVGQQSRVAIPVSFSKGTINSELSDALCLSATGPAKEGVNTHQATNRVVDNGRTIKNNNEDMYTLTKNDIHGVGVEINKEYPNISIADPNDTKEHPDLFITLSESLTVYAIWYAKYNCYITIRKLTPKECFRLQAFPDWLFERAQFVNSDSQLYKQVGNSVTTCIPRDIGLAIADT